MAKDSFEYSSNAFSDATVTYAKLNDQFESDIDALIKSLAEVLGCGTEGAIYDAFCNWFNTEITPKLRAMLSKDEDILKVTRANQQDYDDTKDAIIKGF